MGKRKAVGRHCPALLARDRRRARGSATVRRASERASATSADIEALELSVLLRHGLVGTRRRHIPGLALALLGRRAALVLLDRRRALVLLRRRTRVFLLCGLSGQTLLDKG